MLILQYRELSRIKIIFLIKRLNIYFKYIPLYVYITKHIVYTEVNIFKHNIILVAIIHILIVVSSMWSYIINNETIISVSRHSISRVKLQKIVVTNNFMYMPCLRTMTTLTTGYRSTLVIREVYYNKTSHYKGLPWRELSTTAPETKLHNVHYIKYSFVRHRSKQFMYTYFSCIIWWHDSVYVHILFLHYLYGTAQFTYTYFSRIICTAQLSLCTHTFPVLSGLYQTDRSEYKLGGRMKQ